MPKSMYKKPARKPAKAKKPVTKRKPAKKPARSRTGY